MARKGWDQLSAPYRARLERNGITRESHAQGVSLRAARGHKPSSGRRSETFDRLVRKAEKLHWAPRDPNNPHAGEFTATETILAAMASGMSMAKINRLLDARMANQAAYHGPRNAGPGAFDWHTRTRTEDRRIEAMYWYHP